MMWMVQTRRRESRNFRLAFKLTIVNAVPFLVKELGPRSLGVLAMESCQKSCQVRQFIEMVVKGGKNQGKNKLDSLQHSHATRDYPFKRGETLDSRVVAVFQSVRSAKGVRR